MRILVVDDDKDMRLLIRSTLTGMGYEVLLASDGIEALSVLEREKIQLVISDWLMPKMDGLELCKRIRSSSFPGYVYVIILTAKDSKGELTTAMEAGADDYIAKPFDKNELGVRILAGERILRLEMDLEDRNERLSKALSLLQKDLEAAARIQKDLLPKANINSCGFLFDWIFLPCSFVAGDTFNYMKVDNDHICFFLLDVSGHGVQAAMLSFMLTKTLSSLILSGGFGAGLQSHLLSPVETVLELNRRFQADDEIMQYFTMIYGVMNIRDGRISLVQAGQPSPVYLRKGGEPVLIGSGGFPVGLNPNATFEELNLCLEPGERIILYSDGITDCTNQDGQAFSTERLVDLLQKGEGSSLRSLIERVEKNLREWRGSDEWEDDISLFAIERSIT